VIVPVAITNRVTKALSGIDRDYVPVAADLADGWTLCARENLAARPARLRLIGRRYTYTALLSGYCLPPGLCSCQQTPCVCQEAQLEQGNKPDVLKLIGARERDLWDGSDEEVLRHPRYDELFEHRNEPLQDEVLEVLTERWDLAHLRRAPATSGPIARWQQLNRIRSFLAREHGALVRLAEPAWDPERLAEGQLVLLTHSPDAAAWAARDFVYRLPNLDVPLRVEDLSELQLIIDCGEHDLVRVEQYLKAQGGRPLRLTLDRRESDRMIDRERRILSEAHSDQRLRALIAKPTLARSTPERAPEMFFNPDLDPGQQDFVRRALATDDVLSVQGPPGTGKTTGIAEIIRQYLARDPDAQILLAAQTHQAVDNVLLRLSRVDPDLPIARVASVHTVGRVNDEIRAHYWTESPEPWHPPIMRRAIAYRQLMESQIRAGDRTEDDVMRAVLTIQDDYLASIGPQQTRSERLAQARVIAGTCAAVQGDAEVRAIRFRLAILEEAGKASAPEALMVVLRARKSILVGDSRQLPPHPWDPMQAVLHEPSALTARNPDRAAEADELRAAVQALGSTPEQREAAGQETLFDHFAEHLWGTEHEVSLDMQYRMLPPIGELVSDVFYGDIGGLRNCRTKPIDPRVAAFAGGVCVKLVDIPGQEEKGPDGKSKLRPAEVDHIRTELRAIQQHAADTGPPPNGPHRLGVAVISPYAAQARYLRKHLDLTLYPALNVRIGIVDRFQGDEDQIVILSIAATTVAGFLYVPNRINVAVSRAQDLLIITTSLPAAMKGQIGQPLQQVARFIDQRVKDGNPAYQILRPPQRDSRRRPT
jgi:hypothetical protein